MSRRRPGRRPDRAATAEDLICITGSFFLAAEMGSIVQMTKDIEI